MEVRVIGAPAIWLGADTTAAAEPFPLPYSPAQFARDAYRPEPVSVFDPPSHPGVVATGGRHLS